MKNLGELFSPLRERHLGEPVDDADGDLCIACGAGLGGTEMYEHYRVCPWCGFHYTISARERVALLADAGSFHETHRSLTSIDPISFSGQASYRQRVYEEERRTGLIDAIITGSASVQGHPLVLAVIDFRFFGGSIGCVVGEKLTLAFELAARKKRPMLVVVASGGTRMQEGLLSLAQVAKSAAAAARLGPAGVPFVSLLANPTIGAAYAGFVNLSDIILAEPGAILGYATTRAVEEASGGPLPPEAHTAESHLAHGLIDQIVARIQQRDLLAVLLDMLASRYRLMAAADQQPAPPRASSPPPWNTVQLARHAARPSAREYIQRMTSNFIELHGDRQHGDDAAVVCGLGQLDGETVVLLGQERHHADARDGMIRPEGFRKACRAMQLAAKLRLPLINLVDTPGAAMDLGAEEQGLGNALAACLATAATLPVPSLAAVIGEGGSEAALAFSVANRLLMMEHAIFTPVSPEVAASILYRDRGRAETAAQALRLTAGDCLALRIADGIIPEPATGAHQDHEEAARALKAALLRELSQIQTLPPKRLVQDRYRKLRAIGQYSNYLGAALAREMSGFGEAVGQLGTAIRARLRRPSENRLPESDESLLVP
jgi:acyl-CoA carboxylase subunit beta